MPLLIHSAMDSDMPLRGSHAHHPISHQQYQTGCKVQQAVILVVSLGVLLCASLQPTSAQKKSLPELLLNNPSQWPPYVRGKGQYKFVLSPRALYKSITYESPNERMRIALDRWRRGANLTIATIGGSITFGQGCVDGPNYPQYFINYLQDHYGPSVQLVNGALAATKSSYMALCHNVRIPKDVDIIIVEYSTNDYSFPTPPFLNEIRKAYERLIRKLLSYPKKPAVMLMHSYSWDYPDFPPGTFWTHSEGEHDIVAHYYQLPTVSFKSCCYHLLREQPIGFWRNITRDKNFTGLAEKAFYGDWIHPDGRTGARVLAELLINFFERAIKGLDALPVDEDDRAVLELPLPPPMIPNNHHSLQDQCFMGHSFTHIVTRTQGFEWINEAKGPHSNKWGMVATVVGSILELTVDTRSSTSRSDPSGAAPGGAKPQEAGMLVQLAYLQSYENVGTAEVSCASGCTCQPTKMVCFNERHASQLQMLDLRVTEHEKCTIRVTVLNETLTGSHKVKVSACIVSEEAGSVALTQDNWHAVDTGFHASVTQ